MRLISFCLLALAMAVIALTPARAGLVEPHIQPHLQSFPHCDDPKVLKQIVEKFNWAEDNTWHRGFVLDGLEHTRERQVHDSDHTAIPRRYCRAHALLSNGKHPTMLYLIEGGQGFAGTGFNVEFCINGLDPWRVYDGSCRVLNY
ncbi:hypothetical protein ACFQ14_04510 [Pseudahrensia aquimaris]|uniref:Cytoplasmic protein n=1 Tax=Pseudahrensia aquimaris TaxID=744461 RepID=A0ABW3FEH6_9HYPH